MSIVFTSDLHLFHKNILKLEKRPWDTIEEMHEGIAEIWKSQVKANDDLYHLGDLTFGGKKKFEWLVEYLSNLPGRKHFILGNHDDPRYLNRLLSIPETKVETVSYYKELRYNNHKYYLLHYPMETWASSHKGSRHLHGHCHGNLRTGKSWKRLDVGLDNHPEHRFFSMGEIEAIMDSRKGFPGSDHHISRKVGAWKRKLLSIMSGTM